MTTHLSDFDYELPEDRVAQVPADNRADSRLLVLGPEPEHLQFEEVVSKIPSNAVLVVNDTRVIRARLFGKKPTGGAVELLLLAPHEDGTWLAMGKSSKPLRPGMDLSVEDERVQIVDKRTADGLLVLRFSSDPFGVMERYGHLPLPGYIERKEGAVAADFERYQTLFASQPGAVAAPTAGLHFSEGIVKCLAAKGVQVLPLTLHVGMGTFRPVKTENIDEHVMHEERYRLSQELADSLLLAQREQRPVFAVGTTVVRALESAALLPGGLGSAANQWHKTSLFIRPGFPFQVVNRLITNFHLPKSTLLMMVCAFAGYEQVMAGYKEAIERSYRFFSYGDAMLLSRRNE